MSHLTDKPKEQMTADELEAYETAQFASGPLRVLAQAVQNNATVLISLRNNHKLVAKVKAFDRHCNMVLEKVKDVWSETPKSDRTAKKSAKKASQNKITRERYVSKMFLRGDSVVVILKHGE